MSDRNPIRRAQLVTPFGTGSMFITKHGTSVMTAALDYWFRSPEGRSDNVETDEFKIFEWRLQEALKVDFFLEPPEYRERRATGEKQNVGLTIPTVRFPRWHHCSSCRRLYWKELHDGTRRIYCDHCLLDHDGKKGRRRALVQVPFIAVCEDGHIQDFPFREWVHGSLEPSCNGTLFLQATGGATLSAQKVSCSCGISRPLGNIQSDSGKDHDGEDKTFLTYHLDKSGRHYRCKAISPWKGQSSCGNCNRPLRGALRSASNVYFAKVKSSIYLPQESADVPNELLAVFDEHPVATVFKLLSQMKLLDKLRDHPECRPILEPYNDSQLKAAISIKLGGIDGATRPQRHLGDDDETFFRRAEYAALIREQNLPDLIVRTSQLHTYGSIIRKFFSAINSVDRLRETRALFGFTRVKPENRLSLTEKKSLLRKVPEKPGNAWLPAYRVYGEGMFLVLNESEVKSWLNRIGNSAQKRMAEIAQTYILMKAAGGLNGCTLGSRFLLVHTLAHLLINRLTFECGYNSASLRERLYVSDAPGSEMAAMLIYTAAGDSEGTMGGLVRMSKPGSLEPCLIHALDSARWCSNDPICMEAGRTGGQGPDSCNLAACHSCCLLPETACEESNRFLDRAMVVGDFEQADFGFFFDWEDLVEKA